MVHHIDAAAKLRLVHVGGADEDRKPFFPGQLLQDVPKLAAGQRVDAHRRLVQEQKVGRAHEGTGQPQLLLHAAGQLSRQPFREFRQSRHFQKMGESCLSCLLRHAVEIRVERHILRDGQVLIEAEFLRHVAKPVLNLLLVALYFHAEHAKRPRGGGEQARDQPHQRRLSRAVRPDDGGQAARLQGNVDAAERRDRGRALGRESFDEFLRLDDRFLVHIKVPHGRWRACRGGDGCPGR